MNSSRKHEQPAEREREWLTATDLFSFANAQQIAENVNYILSERYGPPDEHCGKVAEQRIFNQAFDQYASLSGSEVIYKLRKRVRELEREVEVLRSYGNKDCTAMADEALEKGDQ